jgi:hypothetical protein
LWGTLTPVEREYCRLVAAGRSGQALYAALRVRPRTAWGYGQRIGQKLGVEVPPHGGGVVAREIAKLVALLGDAA